MLVKLAHGLLTFICKFFCPKVHCFDLEMLELPYLPVKVTLVNDVTQEGDGESILFLF